MQERGDSIANALELRLSCTNPSTWSCLFQLVERRVHLTKGNVLAQLNNLRQAIDIFSNVRLSLPNNTIVEEIQKDLFLWVNIWKPWQILLTQAPGRFERFKLITVILLISGWVIMVISCEIALKWLSLKLTDDKPTVVQVMAWCHQ